MTVAENILGKIDRKEIDPSNESIGVKLGSLEAEKLIESKRSNCC